MTTPDTDPDDLLATIDDVRDDLEELAEELDAASRFLERLEHVERVLEDRTTTTTRRSDGGVE